MAFRVKFEVRAIRDINSHCDRIAESSPEQAERWYEKLMDRIETLRTLPRRCPTASEGKKFGREVRQLTYGKRTSIYRILFTIDEEEIAIVGVWRADRGPAEL